MVFRDDIIKCYNNYKTLKPLDVTTGKQYDIWINKYQLNLVSYSRIVWEIRSLGTMNGIIRSDFDYDNLYIVIESLINANFLYIKANGDFVWDWLKQNQWEGQTVLANTLQYPNIHFNQFPCNKESRARRVKLFYELFPYVKNMNVWILWDDDLLSVELFKTWFYNPVVYEIDEKVISIINKETNNQVRIVKVDFLNTELYPNWDIDTFITDPPYNLHWLLQFIEFWLHQINREINEFFVIFNKMMLWNNYSNLVETISKKWYNINNIINGFSLYNFPKDYRELLDINKKLALYWFNFSEGNFSSSSSLFHFVSSNFIEHKSKLIYKRY